MTIYSNDDPDDLDDDNDEDLGRNSKSTPPTIMY